MVDGVTFEAPFSAPDVTAGRRSTTVRSSLWVEDLPGPLTRSTAREGSGVVLFAADERALRVVTRFRAGDRGIAPTRAVRRTRPRSGRTICARSSCRAGPSSLIPPDVTRARGRSVRIEVAAAPACTAAGPGTGLHARGRDGTAAVAVTRVEVMAMGFRRGVLTTTVDLDRPR